MSFDKKSFLDIYNNMAADTRRRLPELTDFEEGSVVRSLYESFAYEMAVLYEQLDLVYQAGFVDTAENANLDRVVAALGIVRNEPDYATGGVTFERDKGLNEELVIPIGTLVTSEEDEKKDPPKKAYLTIEEGRLTSGNTSVDVRIQAEERGKSMVGDAETVVVMPRPVPGIKSVTNKKPIRFLGRDRESDVELRQRAKQALLASGRASVTSIENALLGMSGVREVRVREDFPTDSSPGTPGKIDVYVDGLTTQNAPVLRERIDQVRAAGVYVVLKPAIAIHLEGVLQIEADTRISADERPKLEQDVANAIEGLIQQLGMGQSLLFSQLTSEILKVNGVRDVPNFQLTTYREDDSEGSLARGTVTLTRSVKLDNDIIVPANTLVRTAPGQEFLIVKDAQFTDKKTSIDAEIKAVKSGRSGELLRTGDAIAWEQIKAGGIWVSVSNAQPIRIARTIYGPNERRIDTQILERLVPESIRVASEEKPLRVRVQVKLETPKDDPKKQRTDIESAIKGFFAARTAGKSFVKADLEKVITKPAAGAFSVRLVSFPFQGQAPKDDFQIDVSFVEKPEAEIVFVYSKRLELGGDLALVLPLTATNDDKLTAIGAARQAIRDYLDALTPEEDLDLQKVQDAAAGTEKVLRVVFQPEACTVFDAAGSPIKDKIKDRIVSVDLLEKLFLSDANFLIKAQ